MSAEVVDLLWVEGALHMPMDVDGARKSGTKGKGKTKGKSKSDDQKDKGKAKDKGKKVKETGVCHECNKCGHLCKDCMVYKKRIAEKSGNKEKTDTTAAVQEATAAVQGSIVETWEYIEDYHVFAFWWSRDHRWSETRDATFAVDSGASRSACPSGHAPDVSVQGTAPPWIFDLWISNWAAWVQESALGNMWFGWRDEV